jgi:Putative transposase
VITTPLAQPSTAYAPGDPTSTVVNGIIRDHFETFRVQAASLRDGEGLPRFVLLRAGQRARLERLCRYALRPPLAQERLQLTREGEIWLGLRHRWADGTTHLRLDLLEFLERLAVLTPRPRVNLIL